MIAGAITASGGSRLRPERRFHDGLLERFDSLFDLTRDRLFSGTGFTRAFVPPTDLIVADDAVTVVMDVPGFKAEDLDIELTGDVLTIRGERPHPHLPEGDHRGWYRFERGYGKFHRILQVPKGLDPDSVIASIVDGVLTVHIPQPEARKPRRIEITSGATAPALEETASGGETETASDQADLVGAGA